MTKLLSLCMIVKNEEENLDACLLSVKKHVDEIVVVDTGSSDKTIVVAEKHGARVVIFDPTTNPEAFFVDDETTCSSFGAPPPFSGEIMLGDFGAARRRSFAAAQGEYIVWVDADDVVEGAQNLPQIVADMRVRGMDMAFLPYDYARDDQGRTFYRQWRERIIKVGCASWVNNVHEVLLPGRAVTSARYDGVTVAHRRKADRKCVPNRNYKILLRQLEAEKRTATVPDPRTLFYLGQEARWVEPLKAAEFYEAYLGRSGWPEERAAAHVTLGSMCEFGQLPLTVDVAYARANREYATAAVEMPDNPDGLFGLARIAYLRQRWLECVSYTERALAIGNTESMLGANPMDRLYRPHVYYNHALSKLGRLEEAIASCKTALQTCPDDPGVPGGAPGMIKHNLAVYEAELAARQQALKPAIEPSRVDFDRNEDVNSPPQVNIPRDALVIWALQLWKQVAHIECDGFKAREMLRSLPRSITDDSVVTHMRAATEARFPRNESAVVGGAGGGGGVFIPCIPVTNPVPTQQDKLKIVFWVGPSIERWDPETPNKTGIGGSETACIEMAKELVSRGHSVTVFGDLPYGVAKIFDGVHYNQWTNAQPPIECDVFISSRAPQILDDAAKIVAKIKLLWVHDVNVGPDSPQMDRWLLAFDRVLCLSQWHRDYFLSCYPKLDRNKVIVTRNGIDPKRFASPLPVKKNNLVFSSSPNRGLDTLVLNFPHIKAQVPDAELHIYYGFDCWEAFAKIRGDQTELAQIEGFKNLLAERAHKSSGIYLHGRVNQKHLAGAFRYAKVWPHFTTFHETSCISAMEAQAAGALPIHSGVAALSETVKHGVKIDSPQEFVDACVRALQDDPWRVSIADAGRKWALENLSWKALAVDWEEMFTRVVEEMRINPLPKYAEVKR